MTPRQRDILLGIERYLADNPATVPTVSKLSQAVGLGCKGAMYDYLSRLRDQGFLTFTRASKRGGINIALTGKPVMAVEKYDAKRMHPLNHVDAPSRAAEYAEVARQLGLGITHREIARSLGRSMAFVSHVRARLGLKVRNYLHVSESEVAEMLSRFDAGETAPAIARSMGISADTVYRHLHPVRKSASS